MKNSNDPVVLKQHIIHLQSELHRYKQEMVKLKQLSEIEKLQQLLEELTRLKDEIKEKETKINVLQDDLHKVESVKEKAIIEINTEKHALQTENQELKQVLKDYTERIDNLKQLVSIKEEAIIDLGEENHVLQTEKERLVKDYNERIDILLKEKSSLLKEHESKKEEKVEVNKNNEWFYQNVSNINRKNKR
ncbi:MULTISPECIES: hypothetical protein [Sutcliffiella]|uniref:Uncharacterized protein n=1 Tax=Sutcliffiella cohnii TaxID=33932 RepID=A0A223KMD2_9BACI|nr:MULTISPECIES: hypothetical protein [Sutcliffiella]AST90655.1 hypothetical protein BC6307_04840 [Sutcliffiella cohnii]MED4016943.1 hypothetical protein [Sutcliffiella cohnii]WBL16307.1 hypothetical protein O1A01_06655 [Sutcliffiella sp. NC1]